MGGRTLGERGGCVLPILFFGIGAVQFAAFVSGLATVFDLPLLLIALIGVIVSWIPLLGTAAGIYGAIVAWDWPWPLAALLFISPYILGFGIAGYMTYKGE